MPAMKAGDTMRAITASTLTGLALGIPLVLACGDDAPATVDAAPNADAGACSCPAPDLKGRIVVVESAPAVVLPGQSTTISARCNQPGQVLLTGGCLGQDATSFELLLQRSGMLLDPEDGSPQGWTCSWTNPGSMTPTVTVTISCLEPPAASP
jgi:hypothetical protein